MNNEQKCYESWKYRYFIQNWWFIHSSYLIVHHLFSVELVMNNEWNKTNWWFNITSFWQILIHQIGSYWFIAVNQHEMDMNYHAATHELNMNHAHESNVNQSSESMSSSPTKGIKTRVLKFRLVCIQFTVHYCAYLTYMYTALAVFVGAHPTDAFSQVSRTLASHLATCCARGSILSLLDFLDTMSIANIPVSRISDTMKPTWPKSK